jgi:DNA-binding GntR family transcriptional regulator
MGKDGTVVNVILYTNHFSGTILSSQSKNAVISQTNPAALGKAAPSGDPVFKPDLVRRMLLSIFGGVWKAGDRLREERLAALFHVSRTPIREALQELAAVGLVELRPNCGALVAPFGPGEIAEIYDVRALLETEATRLACAHLPLEALRSLEDEMDELLAASSRSLGWSQRAWEADRQLHGLIAAHCPNRRLSREIARYGAFVQIVRETVGNRERALDLAIKEHQAIVAALRRRNPLKAAAAMRRHIGIAGQTAVEGIRPLFAPARIRGRASAKRP